MPYGAVFATVCAAVLHSDCASTAASVGAAVTRTYGGHVMERREVYTTIALVA